MADGVLRLEHALHNKQRLEDQRLAALNDVLVNELGESLDALQRTWQPPPTTIQSYSQSVSACARAFREAEPEESRQRESLQVAKQTDAKIQKLALTQSLRETSEYMTHHANKLGRAAAALPFGASFTYRDLFHTDAVPDGVGPCLDSVQGAPIRCAAFARAGTVLATGDNSCAVRLWSKPLTPAQLAARKEAEAAARERKAAERAAERAAEEQASNADAGPVHEEHARTEGAGEGRGDGRSENGDAASTAAAGGSQEAEAPSAVASAAGSGEAGKPLGPGVQDSTDGPKAPAPAPVPVPAPAGAGAGSDGAGRGDAGLKPKSQGAGGQQEVRNRTKPWRSSQLLQAHKSPVTALVFVGEGELGPKPALLTAAGDWKVVHWEPDDQGRWHIVTEVPVSHAAWIMDLCYVSTTVCAKSETRGPLLITAAGDKSLKVLQHKRPGKHKTFHSAGAGATSPVSPVSPSALQDALGHVQVAQAAEGPAQAETPAKPDADATAPPAVVSAEAAAAPGGGAQGEGKGGAHSSQPASMAATPGKVQRQGSSRHMSAAHSPLKTSPPNLSRQASKQGLVSPPNLNRQTSKQTLTASSRQRSGAPSPGLKAAQAPPAVASLGQAADSEGGASKSASPKRLSRQASMRGSAAVSPMSMAAAHKGSMKSLIDVGASSPSAKDSQRKTAGEEGGGEVDGGGAGSTPAVSLPTPGESASAEGLKSAQGGSVAAGAGGGEQAASVQTEGGATAGTRTMAESPGSSPLGSPMRSPGRRAKGLAVGALGDESKDHKEWEEVATLLGHRDSVYCVCCTQLPYAKHAGGNGTPQLLLGSVGLDWSVRIWRMVKKGDPRKWVCEATIMDATSGQHPGRPLHFMPNDASMIVTANGEDVQLWHLVPGDTEEDIIVAPQCVAALQGHMSAITCVQFRPDSKMIASCDISGEVRLWVREEGEEDAEQTVLLSAPPPGKTAKAAGKTGENASRTPAGGSPGGRSPPTRQGSPGAGQISPAATQASRAEQILSPLTPSLKGSRAASREGRRLVAREGERIETDGNSQVLRLGTAPQSVRIDTPLTQREIRQQRREEQLHSSSIQILPLPDGDRPASQSPEPRIDSADSGRGRIQPFTPPKTPLEAITRRMQWKTLSTSYAGNANARALSFGVDFRGPADNDEERARDDAAQPAMLAVCNNKGRVRMWDSSKLLPLGETLADKISTPMSTAPATPHTARPKTVVDRLSELERGEEDMLPSWDNLAAARPGACVALFPNEAQVAAACYPQVHGGFLMWDAEEAPGRTAAPRNAGALGVGGEKRIFPHTAAITCMAAMHREFTNGQLSAYVVTGAADGTIALTLVESNTRPQGFKRAASAPGEKKEHDAVVKRLTRVLPLADGDYAGPSRPATGHGAAHLGSVLAVQVLGDGRQLLSSGQDGHITIWDTANGAIVHNYWHVTPVLGVACGFPNNKYCALASLFPPPNVGGQGQLVGEERLKAGRPGHVMFINIARGNLLGEPIAVHDSEVTCMSMSPLQDGVKVASCARGDHVIKITSMDDSKVVHELSVPPPRVDEKPPPVCTVRYDPSGKVLASSDRAGMIRLWSPLHASLLSQLQGHTSAVLALDFSRVGESDGRPISRAGHKTPFAKQLVSSAIDGQVRVWQFSSLLREPPHEQSDAAGTASERQSAAVPSANMTNATQDSGSSPVKVREGVGKKLLKSASKSILFTKLVVKEGAEASAQRQEQEWYCSALLQRESLVTQTIRFRVIQLCLDMSIAQDLEPPPPKRGDALVLGNEDEDDEIEDAQEDEDGDENEGREARVASPSNDVDSEELNRAINYSAILKLAEQTQRIGLIDPADDLEEAQTRRTALWEQRQQEEAMALARLSTEERRRAERKRKPRTGPPVAPISVQDSIQRRRAAAALLVRKMEETETRDEPSSIDSLVRLLDASDDAVRAVAALGLGFLASRVEHEAVDDLIRLGDKELDELKTEAQTEVEIAQEALVEVGDELQRVEGEHTKAKLAHAKAVRDAAKDRKAGKEKKQKLNREKLIEAKKYRAAKGGILLRYSTAFDDVLSASTTLMPIQSVKVERILLQCLRDDSARVQEAALYGLAQVGIKGHVHTAVTVAEMVSSIDEKVRTAAGLCLGEIAVGVNDAVDVLLLLLDGQGANGQVISSDHKRSALDALALMMRSRFDVLTRLRQKAIEALWNLQDGDVTVREAAKRLSGYIARQDSFGLEGFRCQADVVFQNPPFMRSSLVRYSASAADMDVRPPFSKPNKRGVEPHSDMYATKLPPSFNQGDRHQVFWPSMSKRLYGGSMANTSVQTPGVLSSITRGDRPPAATANMCRLPSAGVSAPPSKIASVKPGLAAASFKGSTKPNVSSK